MAVGERPDRTSSVLEGGQPIVESSGHRVDHRVVVAAVAAVAVASDCTYAPFPVDAVSAPPFRASRDA